MVEEEEAIFGFPIVQAKGRKRRGKREEIKVWITCMETITSHTCLWVVRKNLTSIMKVLLVGFCGL